jgi:hypothetical protein
MIVIEAITHQVVAKVIATFIDSVPTVFREAIDLPSKEPARSVPFVELAYDEISVDELDRVFSYADIARMNSPIGIDCISSPFLLGGEAKNNFQLFSIDELELAIRRDFEEISSFYQRIGSMDALVVELGDSMTAIEYLVAGVLDCIRFCKEFGYSIAIKW